MRRLIWVGTLLDGLLSESQDTLPVTAASAQACAAETSCSGNRVHWHPQRLSVKQVQQPNPILRARTSHESAEDGLLLAA